MTNDTFVVIPQPDSNPACSKRILYYLINTLLFCDLTPQPI
jgi:hypothetical protein